MIKKAFEIPNGDKIELNETVQMATVELIDKFREFNGEEK